MHASDLIPEWEQACESFRQEIEYVQTKVLNPALPVAVLEAYIADLESLIAIFHNRRSAISH